jgi:SAM-dependent methyltransferase
MSSKVKAHTSTDDTDQKTAESTGPVIKRSQSLLSRVVRRAARFGEYIWLRSRVGRRWITSSRTGLQKREYRSYGVYLEHQKAKLQRVDLTDYDQRFRNALRERLLLRRAELKGSKVLCLAARLGTEVKAFNDLGCFAVGIDLNPGTDNKWVVYGDFHDLQFGDGSVDLVFTNSLDHLFDPERYLSECKRVLRPGGRFIAEIMRGTRENGRPRFFESFWWDSVNDVIALFERNGFAAKSREIFDVPWPGEHVIFELTGASVPDNEE